jgi:eukaryotic-like serine/threonine-protein kinase
LSGEPLHSTDDLVGRVLLGRYRLVRELAKGGMGVVYLARAEGAVGFVKPVVVKLVLPEHAHDQRFVGMFVREAQILAQLRHPSVVDVLEFGEQDGAYVLVLEYVRGYHLGQWMRYLQLERRQAPVEILIQIVIDVLEALHHAHNQVHPDGTPMQIVHRDVSPSNILLDEDGRGRLLDFGIARMRGGAHDERTQFNGFMGKLPYTAPEVFADQDASPRSDLYACGVVLHELLFGRNVFRADNQAATMHRAMNHTPEALEPARPGLPAGLDAVVAKALAKSPGERYPDARTFAAALRKLQREQESDVRARLADLLRVDFGSDMAELLKLESLADREEAWRRSSETPSRPRRSASNGIASDESGATVVQSASARRRRRTGDAAHGDLPPADAAEPERSGAYGRAPYAAQPALPAPGTSVTKDPSVMRELAAAPGVAAAAAVVPRPATPAAEAPAPAAVTAPLQTSRALLLALAVIAGLAIVAIALSLRRPPAPVPAPQIRVVAAPNAPAAEPAMPAPAALAPSAPAAPGAQPDVTHDPRAARPEREVRVRRAGSEPSSVTLTRAFRKQQPKLEACFEQHPGTAGDRATVQIEFDLGARGMLERVALVPKSLAATPLGTCLLRIARSTSFPGQGRAVSFAIPVTTRPGVSR